VDVLGVGAAESGCAVDLILINLIAGVLIRARRICTPKNCA
jgi:hypothetical protein